MDGRTCLDHGHDWLEHRPNRMFTQAPHRAHFFGLLSVSTGGLERTGHTDDGAEPARTRAPSGMRRNCVTALQAVQ